MTRFLLLAVALLFLFLLLRATVPGFVAGLSPRSGRSPIAARDALVKDPECETYIPRRKAITREVRGATHHFCSAGCADRFAARA